MILTLAKSPVGYAVLQKRQIYSPCQAFGFTVDCNTIVPISILNEFDMYAASGFNG